MYSHTIGQMFVDPKGGLRDNGFDIQQVLNTGKEYVEQTAGSFLEKAKETAAGYLPGVTQPATQPTVATPPVTVPALPPIPSVPATNPLTTPSLPQSSYVSPALPPGSVIVERRPGLIEKVPPAATGAVIGAGLWYLSESWVVGLGSAVVTTVLLNRMQRRDKAQQ